jgi:hypothetical protein
MKRSPDVPEVLLFPPFIPLLTLLAGALLGQWLPRRWLARLGLGWRLGIGGLTVLAGAAVAGSGARALARLGTNINPLRPTLAVATEGVFARTRNPMYVGGGTRLYGPGDRPCPGLGLVATLTEFFVAALRGGRARRALPGAQIWRPVPAISIERPTVRMAALNVTVILPRLKPGLLSSSGKPTSPLPEGPIRARELRCSWPH